MGSLQVLTRSMRSCSSSSFGFSVLSKCLYAPCFTYQEICPISESMIAASILDMLRSVRSGELEVEWLPLLFSRVSSIEYLQSDR